MHIAAFLLLNVLVLRSGEMIDISGDVREEKGRVIFRGANGTLYSMPSKEVDLEATTATAQTPALVATLEAKRFKVSDAERRRLIAELEQNHNGKEPVFASQIISQPEKAPNADEEWSWRHRAQEYEESIQRAKENRDLLIEKANALRSHISSLLSLGYKPNQFTYDSSSLQTTLDQIPYADLEVTRTEREYAAFREEARKRAIPPGWLR